MAKNPNLTQDKLDILSQIPEDVIVPCNKSSRE